MAALRHSLACAIHRHGVPGTLASVVRRDEDARIAGLPLHRDVAQAVAARLAELPRDEGIPALELATRALAAGEHAHVSAGAPIPPRLVHKIERALLAPIDELVERGVVGSAEGSAEGLAEVLAIVLAQLT